ncbi:unnamed protein product [Microthlaspi erraticum]|uniref:Uncharacterized protein n=1 Tax=Microthlaspi erraticum TaxID=1685480 RepID=A0A6D2JJC3_9BRAS|nr:unnamed protein product [Microthlaspi erraticum]
MDRTAEIDGIEIDSAYELDRALWYELDRAAGVRVDRAAARYSSIELLSCKSIELCRRDESIDLVGSIELLGSVLPAFALLVHVTKALPGTSLDLKRLDKD